MFIFAEGTTTNGKALIRFHTGGFQVACLFFCHLWESLKTLWIKYTLFQIKNQTKYFLDCLRLEGLYSPSLCATRTPTWPCGPGTRFLPPSLVLSFFCLPYYLDQGPGIHFFLWLPALMSSLHQVHGMRWSMLLLLATPFKTVLTHTCWSLHSLHPSRLESFSNVTTEPPQVTVKFLPVHKPTLEEKADPILYAKVQPFSCGLYFETS